MSLVVIQSLLIVGRGIHTHACQFLIILIDLEGSTHANIEPPSTPRDAYATHRLAMPRTRRVPVAPRTALTV